MTVIKTKRLELRKYDPDRGERLETMARWLNDPQVVRFSEQRLRRHDWESQHEYIHEGPDIFREIHAGNEFIGTITANIDRHNAIADVGILIGEGSIWGQGYGTEAWIAFCDHLFLHKVRKVEAGAMSVNAGMISIFKKSGMTFEGFRNDHFDLGDGKYAHMVMWGKFAWS